MSNLQWKKFHPLSDKNAFICLVDNMGDDFAIVQAARVSYGKDEQDTGQDHPLILAIKKYFPDAGEINFIEEEFEYNNPVNKEYQPGKLVFKWGNSVRTVLSEEDQYELIYKEAERIKTESAKKDRQLIRYLMNHSHTTPFEMVEIKFMVQVPMDCWRQWIRHRTASVNEYSTRYTEALDFFQVTEPTEWRLQATDNKQGSSGFLEEWPEGTEIVEQKDYTDPNNPIATGNYAAVIPTSEGFHKFFLEDQTDAPGKTLSEQEYRFQRQALVLYKQRLALGIAKEQARKDLPLSTYTRAYWKCDLHNIFNFLRLRMDSHAQLEIRSFANCMFEIVKQICPVACEAFEDYVLHAKRFSRMEMEHLKLILNPNATPIDRTTKPVSMTDREWKEFLKKLS